MKHSILPSTDISRERINIPSPHEMFIRIVDETPFHLQGRSIGMADGRFSCNIQNAKRRKL